MKEILIKCAVISLVFLLAVGVAARLVLNASHGAKDEPTVCQTEAEPLYILKDYGGRIALYKRGYSLPVEIFDVTTKSLPQSDKKLIENGIQASSDEEAQKLIEDYTS